MPGRRSLLEALLALSLAAPLGCSPPDDGGGGQRTGGADGGAGTGTGTGGAADGSVGTAQAASPDKCAMKSIPEIETRLILPKCSTEMNCHGDVYPPLMKQAGAIASLLINMRPIFACTGDRMVNKTDPGKSVMLTRVASQTDPAPCPSGMGTSFRMPYMKPRLPQADVDCIAWYVYEISK